MILVIFHEIFGPTAREVGFEFSLTLSRWLLLIDIFSRVLIVRSHRSVMLFLILRRSPTGRRNLTLFYFRHTLHVARPPSVGRGVAERLHVGVVGSTFGFHAGALSFATGCGIDAQAERHP